MKQSFICYAIFCLFGLTSCIQLDEKDVENLLHERHVYPRVVEDKLFCNNDADVARVVSSGLVQGGFMTVQLKHTSADIGKPLIYFTDKAKPYLLPTSDTLKAFDVQKLKIAEEHFLRVVHIEVNGSGDRAVVDYLTEMKAATPFLVLYPRDLSGLHAHRIFFTKKEGQWQWDGRIVKMPRK